MIKAGTICRLVNEDGTPSKIRFSHFVTKTEIVIAKNFQSDSGWYPVIAPIKHIKGMIGDDSLKTVVWIMFLATGFGPTASI